MHEIHAAYLRRLAEVAESRDLDGVLAVRTGIPSNTENGVVSTMPELDSALIAELLDWLAEVPSSWVALDPALGPALAAAGCRPENEAWNMVGEVGSPPSPEHEVRRVSTGAELDEWLATVRECGWFEDVEPARRLYTALGYEGLYLADGGAASAFFDAPRVLLNSVAVRPTSLARERWRARSRETVLRGRESAVSRPLRAVGLDLVQFGI